MSSDGPEDHQPPVEPDQEFPPEPPEEPQAAKRENTERIALRLLNQLNQVRREREQEFAHAADGVLPRGSVDRPTVPYGIDLAAAWAWRLLLIGAAAYVLAKALGFLEVVVIPIVIALLISALVAPLVNMAERMHIRRSFGALIVVVIVIGIIASMLTFAGREVATGASDLATQAAAGLDKLRSWLQTGPLHMSNNQIDNWLNSLQNALVHWSKDGNPIGKVTAVGSIALDVVASMFIVLFSTYFFLAEGARIWAWIVRLAPRTARTRLDSSGKVAWISLTQFVRATVIVAAVDAIGIMIGAAVLNVPFVAAIGVLVFLGAFVPILGATVAGTVAVLIAFVDHGIVTALIMLAWVVGVQQLEAHGLQPFLLGRWVRVHPLAVILSIAVGVIAAGVAGALVAVPLAAATNAVALHLASLRGDEEVEPDAAV
jgi:predicted PurR-regulated permease PerM